jgi:anaerobic dimethyl sulfoxide reductase subunit B (iron-sulfur subunit)
MKEFWRRVTKTEYGTIPPNVDLLSTSIACNHCTNPACIPVCPMQIIYKEPTYGVVLVDNTNCISCGKCQDACPWGAPQFYDPNFRSYTQSDPARPKMTKCTLCIDRISTGLKPACVAGCLNRALDAGPIDSLKAQYPNWAPFTMIVNFPSDSVPALGINTGPNIIFNPRALTVGGQGTIQNDTN